MGMKRLSTWYEKNFSCIEFFAAVLVAAAFFAATRFHKISSAIELILNGSHQTLYATIASIGGSLLGFILTAVSIVIVFGQLPKLRILRQSQQYANVFRVFFQAVNWLAFTTIWALIGLLVDRDSAPSMPVTSIMLFLAVLSAFRVYRCIWVMRAITEIASRPPGR